MYDFPDPNNVTKLEVINSEILSAHFLAAGSKSGYGPGGFDQCCHIWMVVECQLQFACERVVNGIKQRSWVRLNPTKPHTQSPASSTELPKHRDSERTDTTCIDGIRQNNRELLNY